MRYENEIKELLTPVNIKAGEALVFDDSILHYSPRNNTDQDRIAIQCNIVPVGADVFYHEFKPGIFRDTIHKIKINDEQLLQEAAWEKI